MTDTRGPGSRRDRTPIRRLFRVREARPDVERDLDDELAFHFERAVDDLVAAGLDPAGARREAAKRFGSVESYRRRIVDIDRGRVRMGRRADVVGSFVQGLAFAVRGIRRSPGFAAAVILTLGLGIGVNTTMFSVVDRLLLSPPAHVEDADRVSRVYVNRISPFRGTRVTSQALTYPDLVDLQDVAAFRAVAGYASLTLTMGAGLEAERVRVQGVSASMFDLLGVRPRMGRFFTGEEDRVEGGSPVAVLGYGFWTRRFGQDPEVLGRQLRLGSGTYTVIGVAPPGFTGPTVDGVDLWLPLLTTQAAESGTAWADARGWYWMAAVVRLEAGVGAEAAETEATAAHRAGRREQMDAGRYDADARVILGSLVPGRGPEPATEVAVSRWLAGVSLLVLLIAAANVANLLLLRAVRVRRELAVRVALGISRRRLLGHLALESCLLAGLAGSAALVAARWGGGLVYRTLLPDLDPGGALSGPRLMAFTAATAAVTALLAGGVPALQASRPNVTEDLKEGVRGNARTGRLRSGLLVLQVALSVVLLTGAGLFVRSLARAHAVDLGFDPDGVLVATAESGDGTYEEVVGAVRSARDLLDGAPGVAGAALATLTPFRGYRGISLSVPGRDSIPFTRIPDYYAVSEDYFQVMGMTVLRGRGLVASDMGAGAAPVTVLTRGLAQRMFGTEDPLGRCIQVGNPAREEDAVCTEVVGILADHRTGGLEEEDETLVYYLPLHHPTVGPTEIQTLVVRASGKAGDLVPTVRRALLRASPGLRYTSVRPMTNAVDALARSWKLGATLFSLFGVLALAVASLGLYAVISFDLAERRWEMGVRTALGATGGSLAGRVMGRALLLTLLGSGAGLLGVIALSGVARDLLFQISPRDPAVLLSVPVALSITAVVAVAAPAWRATRISPGEALRSE